MDRNELIAHYNKMISLGGKAGTHPGQIPFLVAALAGLMPELPMPLLVSDLQARKEAIEDRAAALAVMLAINCLEGGLHVRDGETVNHGGVTRDLLEQVFRISFNLTRVALGSGDDEDDEEDAGPSVQVFDGQSVDDVLAQVARAMAKRRAARHAQKASRAAGQEGSPPQAPRGASSATETAGGATETVREAPNLYEAIREGEIAAHPNTPVEADAVRSVD